MIISAGVPPQHELDEKAVVSKMEITADDGMA